MDSTGRRLLKLAELSDLPEDAGASQREALEIARQIELAACAADVVYWFNTWVWTYNPKLIGQSSPWLPMDLFPRQVELLRWIDARSRLKEDGHCAKSRDIGFTWLCGGYALHKWLFVPDYKANFGSRKSEYVDRIGDPDSIFEKIRMVKRGLPHWMQPAPGKFRDNSCLLINEEMGSTIRGESGDEMGRGGRSRDYFFDEFAFVERADSVDAASVANAECRIFGSTVNGTNNLFYRMQADDRLDERQKFRFHWSDDPRKRDGRVALEDGTVVSWEKATKRKMEAWKFASEYDIDYTASVEGICIPGSWVEAAKKLRALVHYEPPLRGVAGGDVGAGGKGKSVVVAKFGAMVVPPKSWGHGDTIQTAKDMLDYCSGIEIRRADKYVARVVALNYDSVGVGKGTQDALKRAKTKMITRGVNTGQPPTETRWPDGQTSQEKFANLKAELWYGRLRGRFKKSAEKLLFVEGHPPDEEVNGLFPVDHPIDECILMPSDRHGPDVTRMCTQLSTVRVTSNEAGKILMESKKSMAKNGMPSPDHADALVLTEFTSSEIEKWMKAFGVEERG